MTEGKSGIEGLSLEMSRQVMIRCVRDSPWQILLNFVGLSYFCEYQDWWPPVISFVIQNVACCNVLQCAPCHSCIYICGIQHAASMKA